MDDNPNQRNPSYRQIVQGDPYFSREFDNFLIDYVSGHTVVRDVPQGYQLVDGELPGFQRNIGNWKIVIGNQPGFQWLSKQQKAELREILSTPMSERSKNHHFSSCLDRMQEEKVAHDRYMAYQQFINDDHPDFKWLKTDERDLLKNILSTPNCSEMSRGNCFDQILVKFLVANIKAVIIP